MPASKEGSAKVELMSQQGIAVEVNVTFGGPIEKTYKVNGQFDKTSELKQEDKELRYAFKPNEIIQFQLVRHEY